MSEGLSWQAIGIIVTVLVTLFVPVFKMLWTIGGNTKELKATVKGILNYIGTAKEDRVRIWGKIDSHEKRIVRLETIEDIDAQES